MTFNKVLDEVKNKTFNFSDIRRIFTGLRSANQVGISDIIQTINKGGQAEDSKEFFSSILNLFLIAKDSMSIDSITNSSITSATGTTNKRTSRKVGYNG